MKYICVDFDGTLVDHRYPEIGPPVPRAFDYLKEFQKNGAKIILFTMRSGDTLDEAVNFIKKKGVKLYGVNHNPDQASWTDSPKAYGHVYIDDAAFGCPLKLWVDFYHKCVDWDIVGPQILKFLSPFYIED